MFHVPNRYRIREKRDRHVTDEEFGNNGWFLIPSPKQSGRRLLIVASDGLGWEHVSVHAAEGTRTITPTWDEMCFVKDIYWDEEDVVVQFHPRRSEYVNWHPNTLHLWRPTGFIFPTPDPILVGPRPT